MRPLAHRVTIAAMLVCASLAGAQAQSSPQHIFFRVTLGPHFEHAVSGRLLLFVSRGRGDKAVDMDMMAPAKT